MASFPVSKTSLPVSSRKCITTKLKLLYFEIQIFGNICDGTEFQRNGMLPTQSATEVQEQKT